MIRRFINKNIGYSISFLYNDRASHDTPITEDEALKIAKETGRKKLMAHYGFPHESFQEFIGKIMKDAE